MRFWAVFVLLAPLLWLQGKYARWRTPRLPVTLDNQQTSTANSARAMQLLVLGESPAVGVGVQTADQALPAQFSAALAQGTGEPWGWRVIGENGARLERLLELLQETQTSQNADCVIVVMGVNDCTGLTPVRHWREQLRQLVKNLRASTDALIIFTPVPPMQCFTALPQPLRWVMGLRANKLNREMHSALTDLHNVYCSNVLAPLRPGDLAADGFHPAPAACSEWAQQVAGCITPLLNPTDDRTGTAAS